MKNDGGPAFPQGNDRVVLSRSIEDSQGMTLRDYFAAKAMQGLLTGNYDLYNHEMAETAYAIADAMLKARKK